MATTNATNYRRILINIFLWCLVMLVMSIIIPDVLVSTFRFFFRVYWLADVIVLAEVLANIVAMILLSEVILLANVFYLSITWIVVVIALMAVIRALQFITFRIATYEKGPVLALCGIAGGLAAILKLFA